MTQYLCEIGCEEIPARFMKGILTDMSEKMTALLNEKGIATDKTKVNVLGTYRRLVLKVEGIKPVQDTQEKVMMGPPVSIARNEQGEWLAPAIGFAKKCDVDLNSVEIKTDQQGREVLMVTNVSPGKDASAILSQIMVRILDDIKRPIAMRWGDQEKTFIRPIHWILSLLDDVVVPFTYFDVSASNISFGHRFLSEKSLENDFLGAKIEVHSSQQYETQLASHAVIVDPEKRKGIILNALKTDQKQTNIDTDLLEEVVFLVEQPSPLIIEFDRAFLRLPAIVLVACMKKHQKYFPIYRYGELSNECLVIADNMQEKSRENIKMGNENVLTARLSDMIFFWEEDQKKTMNMYAGMLKDIVFQKGAGSMWDKRTRLIQMGNLISSSCGFKLEKTDVERAMHLSKSDLVTQMVIELPALQGEVGGLYATKAKERQCVVDGIREQYLPVTEKGVIPESEMGVILAISDRLDTMICCFENGLIPTGSKDPWGIRKSMIAILRIIVEKELSVNLETLIKAGYKIAGFKAVHQSDLLAFLKQRIKYFLTLNRSIEIPYDIVDAVLEISLQNPLKGYHLCETLGRYKTEHQDQFKAIVDTAVRIKRIVKNNTQKSVDETLFVKDEEKAIWAKYKKIQPILKKEIKKGAYEAGISHLNEMINPITIYFDAILVMDKDPKIKENRIASLQHINSLFKEMGNFEKIAI